MEQSKKVILFSMLSLLASSNSQANQWWQQTGIYDLVIKFFSTKNFFSGTGETSTQNQQIQMPQQCSEEVSLSDTNELQDLLYKVFPEHKLFGSRMNEIQRILLNLSILKKLTPTEKRDMAE